MESLPLENTSNSYQKISVIGAGSWGTALALVFARIGKKVTLWGHHPGRIEEMKSAHMNRSYLPGIMLPQNIYPTSFLSEAVDADLIFFVLPSKFFREVALSCANEGMSSKTMLISCTKGIERGTGKLMSDVLEEIFPFQPVAVLSGPNLAREIADSLPTAGVIGCKEKTNAEIIQKVFHGSNYRAYTSNDVRGIQLGGALKNIFAIAAGVSDGLGMGENAKAGIVTRSLVEMMRLGVAMGGERKTFHGLSGIGDLMVTCFSQQSRNYQAGLKLCHGQSSKEIQSSMSMVAEGLLTARNAQACARQLQIEVPIIDQVVDLLDQKRTPREAMQQLLGRQLKGEE